MKILSKLWGLIVDDPRLVSTLVIFLILSWILTLVHQLLISALMIWAGLIISLWIALDHQLKLKLSKKK